MDSLSGTPATEGSRGTRVLLSREMVAGGSETLIKWGFRPTGNEHEGLIETDLPPGWSLLPQEYPPDYQKLTDAASRLRGSFTAGSELNLYTYYDIVQRSGPGTLGQLIWYEVTDADGRRWHQTDPVGEHIMGNDPDMVTGFRAALRKMVMICQAYLDQHFPRWQDPTAYWE